MKPVTLTIIYRCGHMEHLYYEDIGLAHLQCIFHLESIHVTHCMISSYTKR